MDMGKVILISSEDIKALFDVKDFVEVVEESYKMLGLGDIRMLPRINLDSEHTPGFLKLLPCTAGSLNMGGVLVYTVGNDQGIDKIVLLFDEKSGGLEAVVEGNRLSWMRTGAASAVATKYLAREDAEVIGIVGSGRQAKSQLMAISTVRKIKLVKVYSPNQEHRVRYCREMSELLGLEMLPVNSVKDAVIGSAVISTTTTSKKPVFDGAWIERGTHINAIGAHYPDQREVDDTTIKRSKIIVDSRERALMDEGELLIPMARGIISKEDIYAELGEIVAGKKRGREGADEITLFTSGGIASEYIVSAVKIFRKAAAEGVGKPLEISRDDAVPKGLYSKKDKFCSS